MNHSRGYTLVELIVAVGLFAVVMTIVSGAYLMVISVMRQAQGTANGINNLSFALETMMRTARTGSQYVASGPGTCGSGNSILSLSSNKGQVIYDLVNGVIRQNGIPLTDSTVVTVSSLCFYVSGAAAGDQKQPYIIITASGVVSSGSGGKTQSFSVETSSTMRGIDS